MITLFLVPTPIGNLGDITVRALEVLKSVNYIFAEDTRVSKRLLNHFGITNKKILSYHKFNEKKRAETILNILKKNSVAIISDAGSPGISDPSFSVVNLAISCGINICALPGATALIPAITTSGLRTDNFLFVGFLPQKDSVLSKTLKKLSKIDCPIIFYEAPHRLKKTLFKIHQTFGERKVSIARELTKIHETFYRGCLSEYIQDKEIKIRGEFTIVVDGVKPKEKSLITKELIFLESKKLIHLGKRKSSIAKIIAEKFGISKRYVYEIIHK